MNSVSGTSVVSHTRSATDLARPKSRIYRNQQRAASNQSSQFHERFSGRGRMWHLLPAVPPLSEICREQFRKVAAKLSVKPADTGIGSLPFDCSHPVTRIRFHRWFWVVTEPHCLSSALSYLAVPLLFLYGLWRILRFKPQCILTIYFNDVWICSAYLLSKATRIPLILYAHDPISGACRIHRRPSCAVCPVARTQGAPPLFASRSLRVTRRTLQV